MKNIYIDYNIILDILDRKQENEIEMITSLKAREFCFFYSPAHIEEVARGLNCGKIDRDKAISRLNEISSITENHELLPYYSSTFNILASPHGVKGIQIANEHPLECFERIHGSIESNVIAENNQRDVITEGQDKFSSLDEKNKSIRLNEINRLDPLTDILGNISIKERLINGFISLQVKSDTIEELMQQGYQIHPYTEVKDKFISHLAQNKLIQSHEYYSYLANALLSPPEKCYYKMKSNFDFIQNMVDIVMKELMRYGYKLESTTKAESTLHDHTHVIYATACDYFICKDKRLVEKAKATYAYLGVNTEVINANVNNWWLNI
ncbi:hypothetical protein [Serratia sp. 2723]|uniref:hypothetical protein n=1 Tax=unclassified Serratia (in: enterobacteria) TaxID=2647522 RepID=UPI003D1FC54E